MPILSGRSHTAGRSGFIHPHLHRGCGCKFRIWTPKWSNMPRHQNGLYTCNHIYIYTSSTAQGGGGSFKNRKPIGEVGCCESGMAERIHWWTERCLRSPTLSRSFSHYLPTYLSIFYVSIYRSSTLSLSTLSIYLSLHLSIYCCCSCSCCGWCCCCCCCCCCCRRS